MELKTTANRQMRPKSSPQGCILRFGATERTRKWSAGKARGRPSDWERRHWICVAARKSMAKAKARKICAALGAEPSKSCAAVRRMMGNWGDL
jgi:hypothetical protein